MPPMGASLFYYFDRYGLLRLLTVLLVLSGLNSQPLHADTAIELNAIGFDLETDYPRNRLYVSVPTLNKILVISTETKTIIDSVTIGSNPHGIDLSSDGNILYVALNGAGKVAAFNLTTGNITEIPVGTAMGSSLTYDVVDAGNGQVVVTANPGSGGSAMVALIKTDSGNQVSIIADGRIIRADPVLLADRINHIVYIGEGFSPNSLYKLNMADDTGAIVLEDDHGSVGGTHRLALNADGTRIALGSGQILRTESFLAAGQVSGGVPLYNQSGSRLYVRVDASRIDIYNTTPYTRTGEINPEPNCGFSQISRMELSGDGAELYLLGDDILCVVSSSADSSPANPGNNLGGDAFDLALDSGRRLAYISVPTRDEVVLMSLDTLKVIRRVPIGSRPHGIEISGDSSILYVALNGAASVATLNLSTMSVNEIIVGKGTDNSMIHDVVDVGNGRLVVTANPGSSGLAKVAMVKTNAGNQVSTIAGNNIIRADPVLVADRTNHFVYIGEGFIPNSLYKLNLGDDDGAIIVEDPHGSSVSGTLQLALHPDGTRIALGSGQILRTGSFLVANNVTGGFPLYNHDGKRLYMGVNPRRIDVFNTTNYTKIGEINSDCGANQVTRMAVTEDEDKIYLIGGGSFCRISLDADNDGLNDFEDPDDDNDGSPDTQDLFPLDPTIQNTITIRDFYPLETGDSWMYTVSGGGTITLHVPAGSVIINGQPARIVTSTSDDSSKSFYSNNDGIRLHGELSPEGDGTYFPPVRYTLGSVSPGQAMTESGTAQLSFVGLGEFTFNYTSNTTIQTIERITVPVGTFNNALKYTNSATFSGVILGVPLTITQTSIQWIAKDVGLVKEITTVDGVTETYELLSYTVDHDKDGINNVIDNCAGLVNPDQLDTDGDKKGDPCDSDDDGDGIPDLQDTFPLDPAEAVDTDNDGTGNHADPDDDNDGLPDQYEISTPGFDPLNPADAGGDADGDGMSNRDEYLKGLNPVVNEPAVILQILMGLD